MQQSRGRNRAPLTALSAATIITAITIAAATAHAGPPVTATQPLHTAAEPPASVREHHTARPPIETTSSSAASNALPALSSATATSIAARFPYRLSVTPAILTDAAKAGQPVVVRGKDIVVISSNMDLVLNAAADQNVFVLGNENHITVRGGCIPLLVSGSGNIVEVQTVRYIETRGEGNSVFYNSETQEPTGAPHVVNGGKDNLVLPVAYM